MPAEAEKATTMTVTASLAVGVSRPGEVARVTNEAAQATA